MARISTAEHCASTRPKSVAHVVKAAASAAVAAAAVAVAVAVAAADLAAAAAAADSVEAAAVEAAAVAAVAAVAVAAGIAEVEAIAAIAGRRESTHTHKGISPMCKRGDCEGRLSLYLWIEERRAAPKGDSALCLSTLRPLNYSATKIGLGPGSENLHVVSALVYARLGATRHVHAAKRLAE